ncbi:hypothetical protein [Metapseudomonas furukawaii]|uniref:hypothetical protein n=1 Tax=Metapseudomonas furukawaii TaxID=1149133 RepID=UPI00056B5405|nr:hypothetical protein [Pseudomonas furukawaii]
MNRSAAARKEIPQQALRAFYALKAQAGGSVLHCAGEVLPTRAEALQALSDNEPWTNRIIRAMRQSGGTITVENASMEWLEQLASHDWP